MEWLLDNILQIASKKSLVALLEVLKTFFLKHSHNHKEIESGSLFLEVGKKLPTPEH